PEWCRLTHDVTRLLKLKIRVATRRSQGISLSKVACPVLSRRIEPKTLPRKVIMISGRMRLSNSVLSARRYAPVEARVPGHKATVPVALALIDGTPVKSNAGKAKNPPPPATEFTIPPAMAAKKSRMEWCELTQHSSGFFTYRGLRCAGSGTQGFSAQRNVSSAP